jgi:hypothetical protein
MSTKTLRQSGAAHRPSRSGSDSARTYRDSGGGDGLDPGHDIGVLVGVVQARRVAVVREDIGTGDGLSREAVHNCDLVAGLCIECLPQPKPLSAQRIELTVRHARPFHPMFAALESVQSNSGVRCRRAVGGDRASHMCTWRRGDMAGTHRDNWGDEGVGVTRLGAVERRSRRARREYLVFADLVARVCSGPSLGDCAYRTDGPGYRRSSSGCVYDDPQSASFSLVRSFTSSLACKASTVWPSSWRVCSMSA